ncbi:MAG: tyrosine-type recombinase/integrase, partial [Geminicoccaceae bacterium]
PFSPAETASLFDIEPDGSALGDVMRIALSTGARLEEIAGAEIVDVDHNSSGFWIREGKSENAERYVPLGRSCPVGYAAMLGRVGR